MCLHGITLISENVIPNHYSKYNITNNIAAMWRAVPQIYIHTSVRARSEWQVCANTKNSFLSILRDQNRFTNNKNMKIISRRL